MKYIVSETKVVWDNQNKTNKRVVESYKYDTLREAVIELEKVTSDEVLTKTLLVVYE